VKILFIDSNLLTKPYDTNILGTQAMGGTEASVVRVAQGLSEEHVVYVAHYPRKHDYIQSPNLSFIGRKALAKLNPDEIDRVIVLRSVKTLSKFTKKFVHAQFFVWLHDLPNRQSPDPENERHIKWLKESKCTLVGVSKSHIAMFSSMSGRQISTTYIYNPIDEHLKPNSLVAVDPNRLLFYSSPHKGLNEVLGLFRRVKKMLPDLKLYIANPGYLKLKPRSRFAYLLESKFHYLLWKGNPSVESEALNQEGVYVLGVLTHQQLIEEVRKSCCIFYPQTKFPETFGLVYAESNAVGTPVLAHDFGAAREVLSSSDQLVNAFDEKEVFDKLTRWTQDQRPQVSSNPQVRLGKVVSKWLRLLESQTTGIHGDLTMDEAS